MKAKHWYDYLWVYAIIYFALGFFNILFAWLGMIDFLLPLFLAIFGGNKFFCNHPRPDWQFDSPLGARKLLEHLGAASLQAWGAGELAQAHAALDVLQVVPLWLFDLFPDDVRQHGVPDLSGRCGCCVPAGGH